MVQIERLIETGAVRGPYRKPSWISRTWRWFAGLFEPVPEDRPVIAVILRDPAAEIEDVCLFDGTDSAYEWLAGRVEEWAGGYIALWEPKRGTKKARHEDGRRPKNRRERPLPPPSYHTRRSAG